MFSPRFSTVATAAIGTALLGLAAAATAGPAVASSTDDVFIAQLRDLGISFTSSQEAVGQGHQVCVELLAGRTGVQVANNILSQTNLTPRLAASFVINATRAYCPELLGKYR